MLHTVFTSWPLFLGMGLLMIGNGLQGTLLGVRAGLEGFPTTVIGLVMAGFYVGLLLGSAAAPRLIARVGHVRVFAAFTAIASATVLLHAVFVSPFVWALIRIVAGFSFAALFIVAESWLNSETRNENRGKVLSVYLIVSFAGASAGQILLNAGDPAGFVLFVMVSVLLSVAVVPMLLSTGSAPAMPRASRLHLVGLFRTSPLGVAGTFTSGLMMGSVMGMGAVFATQAGLGVAQVSSFMFATLAGVMLFQFPLGAVADRFDRRIVIIVVAACSGAMALGAAHFEGWTGLGLMVIAAALGFPLYSISIAHTNDYLEHDAMVAAASGLMAINGIGSVIGPLAVSLSMSLMGAPGFALLLGVAQLTLALFGVYRSFRRQAVPLDERGPTIIIPRATAVATVLAQETALERMDSGADDDDEARTDDPQETSASLV
ncbi:MAG: MFS transporter [Pseudomonadota bacterium]